MEPDTEDKYSSPLDSSLESSDVSSGDESKPPQPNSRQLRLIAIVVMLVIVGLIGLLIISFSQAKKPAATIVINTQNLDAGTLTKLESQNSNGAVAQQLTISPNTLFKNNVDVQGNLTVNGMTHLQGAVTLNNGLAIGGSLTIANNASIGSNLSVTGLITASGLSVGNLTIASLHSSGDLIFGGHLVATGSTPSVQPGTSAGNGATVIISGSDTNGTITINTGSSASVAGELALVTFHTAFKLAPHVQLTPLNLDTATVQYYVSRSATFFTVNTASSPKPNTSYSYDYLVSQ